MSKRRDVLLAIKAMVSAAMPAASIKGFDGALSQMIRADAGGTSVGRPPEADPEPEIDLSPLTYHYDDPIGIELPVDPAHHAESCHAVDVAWSSAVCEPIQRVICRIACRERGCLRGQRRPHGDRSGYNQEMAHRSIC